MKRIIMAALATIMCVSLAGCASEAEAEMLNGRIDELQVEIASLEAERDALTDEIVDIKVEKDLAKYVVTFNIKQSHFTLDIGQHLKDEMNDISIQIPVDKDYYDSVEVGDVINDDFRMGSFIFKGSFGNWDITVEDKEIV